MKIYEVVDTQDGFAISNTDVLVKTQFKIFRLSGDAVESQLIPALQYFEKGVTLSELITLLSIDNSDKFVKDVIQPMVVRHWLTTNTETVTLDNHLQISNAFSSLGANGLEITDYLYKENCRSWSVHLCS